jgi:hypothetical protein
MIGVLDDMFHLAPAFSFLFTLETPVSTEFLPSRGYGAHDDSEFNSHRRAGTNAFSPADE